MMLKRTRKTFFLRQTAIMTVVGLLFFLIGCYGDDPQGAEDVDLPIPNADIVSSSEENTYDLTTEEGRRMESNKRIITENLPMIDFSQSLGAYGETSIELIMRALEELKIGSITSFEYEFAPAWLPSYGENERINATFLDDLGSTFEMHVDMGGYVYVLSKVDSAGNFSMTQVIPDIDYVDPIYE